MKSLDTVYRGWRVPDENRGGQTDTASDVNVAVDDKPLCPGPSLKLRNHSPTGFQWGYGGSGPHQLALAILLDFYGDKELALELYHSFVASYVSGWEDSWTITGDRIERWRTLVHAKDDAVKHADYPAARKAADELDEFLRERNG